MYLLRHLSGITAPVIAGNHADAKGRQQGQQFPTCLIGTWAEGISQYATRFGIVSIPEPVLAGFTANKAPLLIKLADECHIGMSDRRSGYPGRRELFNVRMTVLIPTLELWRYRGRRHRCVPVQLSVLLHRVFWLHRYKPAEKRGDMTGNESARARNRCAHGDKQNRNGSEDNEQ
jgi:hypothetical protein